ncbi:MAG: DUF3048 domain-containing protein [Clostridia bacterium]|nr:DUF3048 domain-containing protein [Clostridia bacterium]
MNKELKIIVSILITVIVIAGGILGYKIYRDKKNGDTDSAISLGQEIISKKENDEGPKPVTFAGNDRAIAVMIDNHEGARPQAGLNDAALVYEIIVEGGMTRLMPVFKGANVEKIGPVRSSRHYFLDYALENDAIYVHYGWSPQAQSDISTLNVNNINGISESSSNFSRVKEKSSPHNVVTSIEKIKKVAEGKKYRTTSSTSSVLNYVTKEVNLDESTAIANTIEIPFSNSYKVKYVYNAESKRYVRYANNVKQTDWTTKEDVTTKNLIITFAQNRSLNDGENKGRQDLSNIGTLKGYYITNGKAIEITCEKTSRKSQTVYRDLQGNIIDVNDGNTFVSVCPLDAALTIN